MDFLQNYWGDLASALGLAASVLGLIVAAWAALNARSARQAAVEARDRIGRTLVVADVQKAIDLIERLKERHAVNRWDAAADRYPDLRELLYDVEARLPGEYGQMKEGLIEAAAQALELETLVNRFLSLGHSSPESATEILESLNRIQAFLQHMASRLNWERDRG